MGRKKGSAFNLCFVERANFGISRRFHGVLHVWLSVAQAIVSSCFLVSLKKGFRGSSEWMAALC